jgi:hypothetical protein
VVELRAAILDRVVNSIQRRITSAGKTCNGSDILVCDKCVLFFVSGKMIRQVFPLLRWTLGRHVGGSGGTLYARLKPMLLALLCLNNPGLRLQDKDIDMFRSTHYDHATRFLKSIYSCNTVVYARRPRSGMDHPRDGDWLPHHPLHQHSISLIIFEKYKFGRVYTVTSHVKGILLPLSLGKTDEISSYHTTHISPGFWSGNPHYHTINLIDPSPPQFAIPSNPLT